MVTIAVMGVLMAAMTSMSNVQNRENAALMEKIVTVETMRLMTQTASDATACAALFDPANIISPSPATFNGATVSPTAPFVITLRRVPGVGPAAPNVATANQALSPSSSTVVVPATGIKVKVIAPNSAELVVGLDHDKLVRAIHDPTVRLNVATTGPPNALQITSCFGGLNGPLQVFTATDFASLTPVIHMNTPTYYAVEYNVSLPVKTHAQRLVLATTGIWNILTCGTTCSNAVAMYTIVNGVQRFCGQNASYGFSSPYDGYPMTTVTCMADVPANATVSIKMFFDARNGARANYQTSYGSGGAGPTTPVLSVLSIPNG